MTKNHMIKYWNMTDNESHEKYWNMTDNESHDQILEYDLQ
jgi:hypothetical protein